MKTFRDSTPKIANLSLFIYPVIPIIYEFLQWNIIIITEIILTGLEWLEDE